ncbi:MAG: RluA family pseudouridine synthase [Myxococcales bacterium]|nr:RluA family pseudouridine synthase [Myxococcales bacterium]
MSESPETPALLRVPASLDGARLDKALGILAEVSRAKAKALLENGVRLNGRRAVKGALVKEGDTIEILEAADEGDMAAQPDPSLTLDVRLETDRILVVHKPAGLPTAPLRAGELGTLANAIVARFPDVAGVGPEPREPGLVHRLDTDTTGLVVVARNDAAFEELKNALRDGRVDKRYLAIVAPGAGSARAASVAADGILPDTGAIDIPLAPHPKDKRRVFACVHARDVARLAPRPATTSFEVKRRWENEDGDSRALVEARAAKALRHQIRVHFAALGAPLLGDGLYGGPSAPDLARHALHASRVSYGGGKAVPAFVVEAELPEDLAACVPAEEPS